MNSNASSATNFSDAESLARLNTDLTKLLLEDATQHSELTCYLAYTREIAPASHWRPDERCIVVVLRTESPCVATPFTVEVPALLCKLDDGSAEAKLGNCNFVFPPEAVDYVMPGDSKVLLLYSGHDSVTWRTIRVNVSSRADIAAVDSSGEKPLNALDLSFQAHDGNLEPRAITRVMRVTVDNTHDEHGREPNDAISGSDLYDADEIPF